MYPLKNMQIICGCIIDYPRVSMRGLTTVFYYDAVDVDKSRSCVTDRDLVEYQICWMSQVERSDQMPSYVVLSVNSNTCES